MLLSLKSGDEFVVIAYDRTFRSVIEGLHTVDELTARGVILKSLTQKLDVTTPDGRLFFTLTIAIGEWEVNNLSARTVSGLKAAIQRGEKLGRPRNGEDLRQRKKYRDTELTVQKETIRTNA